MGNNHTLVSRGFRILLGTLAPYIARELGNSIGTDWWQKAVIDILYEDQKRDLPIGMLFFAKNCPSTTAPGPRSWLVSATDWLT